MSIIGGDIVAIVTAGVLKQSSSVVAPPVTGAQTSLDKKLLKKVEKILDKVGKVLIFNVYADETFDKVTSEQTKGDKSTFNKKSIPPFKARIEQVDGDVVQQDDFFTGIAGKDLEFIPLVNMEVAMDSAVYRILRVAPIYSGERICLYVFQLRK